MSLLNKEIDDFEGIAYHQNQFKKITKKRFTWKMEFIFLLSC